MVSVGFCSVVLLPLLINEYTYIHTYIVANCNQPKSSKVSKQTKRTVNQISAQPDSADDGGQRSSSRAAADVNNASTPCSAVNRVEVMIS